MHVNLSVCLCVSTGQHTWLLAESNSGVEVPNSDPGGETHWPLLQSTIPGNEHLSELFNLSSVCSADVQLPTFGYWEQ